MIEKDSICKEIVENNRLFTILSEKLKAHSVFEQSLYIKIVDFIDQYLRFHKLSAEETSKYYLDFIKAYNKDVRRFSKDGKYPLEIDPKREAPSRIAYNVVLLLSTILNPHRFKIMRLIDRVESGAFQKALFIGCGPGLEIHLCKDKADSLVAYDLTLDEALFDLLKEVEFRNEYFDGSNQESYDSIFLIEILEHLSDPYKLLKNCLKVLNKEGKIYLTTATDIPQFDHLFNFPSDHRAFDNTLIEMGYEIVFKEPVLHESMTVNVDAKNEFYIISKKQ